MTSQWALRRFESASRLFSQLFVQVHIKENFKDRVTGLCVDGWTPLSKGQWCGKCFHLIMSSCMHLNHKDNFRYSYKYIDGVNFHFIWISITGLDLQLAKPQKAFHIIKYLLYRRAAPGRYQSDFGPYIEPKSECWHQNGIFNSALPMFWCVDVLVCRRFGLSTFRFVDVSVSIVYSAVCSGVDQRKHYSSFVL